MKVNIRGRHLKITPEMEEYATEKVTKFDKFFQGIDHADVVMAVEGLTHHTEISVTLGKGAHLFAKAEAEDMYAAIDMAESKLEKQIRRFHARLKAHRDRSRIGDEQQSTSEDDEATYERVVREMLENGEG
jgi:putative sigma-54 modulation protein